MTLGGALSRRLRSIVWACVVLSAPAGAAPAVAARAERVGTYGAPRSFKFEGCRAFPPEQIAAALARNLEVQLRSAPSAPLQDYLDAVRDAVRAGYQRDGYLTATVTAARDAKVDAVVVKVGEGPRFNCGQIRVTGAKALPVERLIAKLTSERPVGAFPEEFSTKGGVFHVHVKLQAKDPERAAWRPGEPARGDPFSAEKLNEAIRRSSCELGFFETWFEAQISTDGPAATLNINIRDEGPAAVLDAVDVTGARRNGEQRVAEYLGLEVGKALDLTRLREAQEKLWASARFTDHTVIAEPRRGDPSRLRVRVELTELDDAPPLDKPFSEVEQVALKFRQWALSTRERQEDWRAKAYVDDVAVDLAVGDGSGVAARAAGTLAGERIDLGAFMTADAVGICAPGARREWVARPPSAEFYSFVGIGPTSAPPTERQWQMPLSAGFQSRHSPGARPMELKAVLAPVAFVHMAHIPGNTYDLRDGVLTMSSPDGRLRIEATTGRLLEMVSLKREDGTARDDTFVTAAVGGLDDMVRAMRAGAANEYDAAAPVGSLARFLVTRCVPESRAAGEAGLAPRRRDALAAAARLLTADALAPLEQVATSVTGMFAEDAFDIPPVTRPPVPLFAVGPALAPLDELFPRGSWPWSLSRLALLIQFGEFAGAEQEVARLMASNEVGPLGYLAAAELLGRADPRMAAPFARRGLERLGVEWFERDVDQLLAQGLPPFEVLRHLAGNLRGLAPGEVEVLAAELPPDAGAALVRLADQLRTRRDADPGDVLRAALRDAWAAGLKARVEARLLALQQPDAPRPAPGKP